MTSIRAIRGSLAGGRTRAGAAEFPRWLRRVACVAASCGALACGAPKVGLPPPPLQATPVPPAAEAAPEPHADRPEPLSAVLLGQLPEGTFGPYLGARRDGRALALPLPLERLAAERRDAVAFLVQRQKDGAIVAALRVELSPG